MEVINKKFTLVVDERDYGVIKKFYNIMKTAHCKDSQIIDIMDSIATKNTMTNTEEIDIVFVNY